MFSRLGGCQLVFQLGQSEKSVVVGSPFFSHFPAWSSCMIVVGISMSSPFRVVTLPSTGNAYCPLLSAVSPTVSP